MKWRILFALDIFFAGIFFAIPAPAQENYNYLIVANRAAGAKSFWDIQYQLYNATGHEFKLIQSDSTYTTGIQLILLGDKDAGFDKRLSRDDPDAFLIQSDGHHSLKIASFSSRGLSEGVYTYLDQLGFRWFHPGDEWTYTPKLKDIGITCDKVETADFKFRSFFGTFGSDRYPDVDPKKRVEWQWTLWSTRNRMAGGLPGHAWNEFLWRNVHELVAHPEYMALIDGKRVTPNTAQKFCISNKDFQQLFIKDMVAQLRKQMGNSKRGFFTVSVEPSDGEGDCQCDECKKLGSVSNRDFLLANLVAKEFQKISPNAYVNLYAYNTHAAPPDFDLEPNVLVQIIPYGFQSFSSPEQMIAAWKKKDHDLYIYDYYGLPTTNLDMPLRGNLEPRAFANRIRYWYDQHIKGASLESSYSIGATGIGLYLFGKMSWDVHSDVSQLLDEYYKLNYGKAAQVLRQSEEALSDNALNKHQSLDKAAHLVKQKLPSMTAEEQTHLSYYKDYLVYLKILYDVQAADAKTGPALSDSLMRYAFGIFQTMEVHQNPLFEYLKARGPAPTYVYNNWGPEFKTLKLLTTAETDALFDKTFN